MLTVIAKEDNSKAHFVFSDYFTKEHKLTETYNLEECEAIAKNLTEMVKRMQRARKNQPVKSRDKKQTAKLLNVPVAH